MSALKKLLKRCNDMDITEQLNIFDDAFLPEEAAAEFAAMRMELDHRWVRCTFCGWGFPYHKDVTEQAQKDANAHAATCELDPRNIELAALRDDLQQTVLAVGLHKEAERVLRGRVEGVEALIAKLREAQDDEYDLWAQKFENALKGGDHA